MEDDIIPFSYVSCQSQEFDAKEVKTKFISLKDCSENFVTTNINKTEKT